MAISTYDDVIAALGNWLERADLPDRGPEFITLVEAALNRTLRTRQMETRSISSLGVNDEFFDLPDDFLEEKSIKLDDGACSWMLDPRAAEELEAAPIKTGRPMYYALVGDAIHLYPKPDNTYTVTLIYYARIPALSEINQTNWLLSKAPDAYLYGALTHAAPFLEDDTGAGATFAQLYLGAITGLKAERRIKVGSLRTDLIPSPTRHNFNINRGDI